MRVDATTKKEEVSLTKECKHLIDLCEEIVTKGDRKETKREAVTHLNQKY